jgi:hypothetical protein
VCVCVCVFERVKKNRQREREREKMSANNNETILPNFFLSFPVFSSYSLPVCLQMR